MEDLFAQAVAQGMHSPFSLNCEEWGRTYADRLEEALGFSFCDPDEVIPG